MIRERVLLHELPEVARLHRQTLFLHNLNKRPFECLNDALVPLGLAQLVLLGLVLSGPVVAGSATIVAARVNALRWVLLLHNLATEVVIAWQGGIRIERGVSRLRLTLLSFVVSVRHLLLLVLLHFVLVITTCCLLLLGLLLELYLCRHLPIAEVPKLVEQEMLDGYRLAFAC